MNPLVEYLPWVQAFGWSLVHFVWQGLLIGILFAAARALVPNDGSATRYALGLGALALLATCPLLTLWVLWPHSETIAAAQPLGDGLVTVTALSTGVIEPGSALGDALPALVLGWLAGVLLMIGRAAYQWRALDRIATRLAHQCDEIDAMLMRVSARLGEVPGVRVLVSAFIETPTLIGWFKPVILLPAAVVARFPREQLELILAHELGHLRRYDQLVNLAQAIVETLLFYHPVVHWISREVRHEREICCDNLVLQLTRSEPREYARTLAALEDVRQLTPQLAVAASGGMLLDRVRRIVGAPARTKTDKHAIVGSWLAATAATIAIVATLMAARTEVDESLTQIDQPEAPTALASISVAQDLALAAPQIAVRFAELSLPERVPAAVDTARSVVAGPAPTVSVASVSELPAPTIVLPPPEVADIDAQITADADVPTPPTAPVASSTALASPALPTLLRMVEPTYPNEETAVDVRVGFEFSVDDSGKVRGVNLVSGEADSEFANAARRALRQWRFDPDSRQLAGNAKYRQEFAFLGGVVADEAIDHSDCVQRTGSHVCRPLKTSSSRMATEDEYSTSAHVVVLSGRGSH
jgi:TonB family protein